MYFIERHDMIERRGWDSKWNQVWACLYECSAKEFEQIKADMQARNNAEYDDKYRTVEPISSQAAHRWVRSGRLHNTGLYLDGNFIRKAKENN